MDRLLRKMTLRTRLLLSFVSIVLFLGLASAVLGTSLIHRSFPQVQDVLAIDLSAAREIYRQQASFVTEALVRVSQQRFLREGIQRDDLESLLTPLETIRESNSLDFLIITDTSGKVRLRVRNPAEKSNLAPASRIAERAARELKGISATEVFSREELEREDPELARRAHIDIVSTSYARPREGGDISSGMVTITGAPILNEQGVPLGVLCGGQLLNRQSAAVDRIRNNLYQQEKREGQDVAVVSLFLGDKRIATSATDSSGQRALGTLVSEDVYNRVILGGKPWIDRGFVVNDWYLTAYEPIKNLNGDVIGMMGLGLLERKFTDEEQRISRLFLWLTVAALALAVLISYALMKSIMKPLNALMVAAEKIAAGTSIHDVKLDHSPPEIDALVRVFNRMQAAIRERRRQNQEKLARSDRLATIGQLAAGVAHEINNPLGSILLFSRLIMQQVPPEGKVHENLERIEKETKRCHSIVQSLLDFARQHEPKVEPVDIHKLLDSTLKLFENQYLFHNIEVVRNYAPDLPLIYADQSQLQQVAMNIIINAADAMNGKGRLTIEICESAEEGQIEISITDTGTGIPSEIMNRIFDPFFTTKGVGHGTGLGLSVSYGIIQRHNGDISVSSAPGVGSTFTITLPKMKEPV